MVVNAGCTYYWHHWVLNCSSHGRDTKSSTWWCFPVKFIITRLCRAMVLNLLTSADPHWTTTGSRGPLSHFYDLNLKTIHKKYTNNTHNKQIHKLRNSLFNSQTKKYKNRNFNFNGKVDAVSVLKFSISDFAFLRIFTLLICWEKLFNFLNSRGPPRIRGPQVSNRLRR
jgi:hypothetical protein